MANLANRGTDSSTSKRTKDGNAVQSPPVTTNSQLCAKPAISPIFSKSASDSPVSSYLLMKSPDSIPFGNQSVTASTDSLAASNESKKETVSSSSNVLIDSPGSKSASDSPSDSSKHVTSSDSKRPDYESLGLSSSPMSKESKNEIVSPMAKIYSPDSKSAPESPSASSRRINSPDSKPPNSPPMSRKIAAKSQGDRSISARSSRLQLPSFALTWSVPNSSGYQQLFYPENPGVEFEAPPQKAYIVQFVSELPFESQKTIRAEAVNAKDEQITEVSIIPDQMNWLKKILPEAKPFVTHYLPQSPSIQPSILSTSSFSPTTKEPFSKNTGYNLTRSLMNEIFAPIPLESEAVQKGSQSKSRFDAEKGATSHADVAKSEKVSEKRVDLVVKGSEKRTGLIEKSAASRSDLSAKSEKFSQSLSGAAETNVISKADPSIKSERISESRTDPSVKSADIGSLTSTNRNTSRSDTSTSRQIVSVYGKSNIQISFRASPSSRSCHIDIDDDYFYRLITAINHFSCMRESDIDSSMFPVCNDCGFLKTNNINQKCNLHSSKLN